MTRSRLGLNLLVDEVNSLRFELVGAVQVSQDEDLGSVFHRQAGAESVLAHDLQSLQSILKERHKVRAFSVCISIHVVFQNIITVFKITVMHQPGFIFCDITSNKDHPVMNMVSNIRIQECKTNTAVLNLRKNLCLKVSLPIGVTEEWDQCEIISLFLESLMAYWTVVQWILCTCIFSGLNASNYLYLWHYLKDPSVCCQQNIVQLLSHYSQDARRCFAWFQVLKNPYLSYPGLLCSPTVHPLSETLISLKAPSP